jgi:hypothetical protein
MKVCNKCGSEISTRDGDNHCQDCKKNPVQATRKRKAIMDSTMRDLGLTKVRGALGGTYWE